MTTTNATNNCTCIRPILFAAPGAVTNVLYTMLLLGLIAFGGCGSSNSEATPDTPDEPKELVAPAKVITTEMSLFDGESLGDWKITDFGGQGDVYIKDGAIYMEIGQDMTGITWAGPLIRMDYEITLETMRFKGSDFFCGLTFPVADKPCSLILGGWGGDLCGLSNIDYYDAANNETTRLIAFENNKWYRVRLRVTPGKIEAWLDDEVLVNVETKDRHIDIRAEVDLSQPLGFATWQTGGAVRNIIMKPVTGGAALPSDSNF